MKTIYILGHFAFGKDISNGQTIKTNTITKALQEHFGYDKIGLEDTHGRWKYLLRLPFSVFRCLRNGRNVIIMPAYKGILFITPLLILFNTVFHRHIHYVVIGGWLPSYTHRFPWLRWMLKRFDSIYVETHDMQEKLQAINFQNVFLMPNCKNINIVCADQLPITSVEPFHLCTCSRVIKEKGIEDAIMAVKMTNEQLGRVVYTLHIYGQIEQPKWFHQLMEAQPEEIIYKGIIPFDQTTDTLKDYFMLLFPTYYRGEAFAGTLIDALAAGLPVIATDWHANSQIVCEGKTGFLFPPHSVEQLSSILQKIASQPEVIDKMRRNCIEMASSYQPNVVLQTLYSRIR